MVSKIDLDAQPETEMMSLTTQAVSLFNSMDLGSQPDPLRKLISLISGEISHVKSVSVLKREQDPELRHSAGSLLRVPRGLYRNCHPEIDTGTKLLKQDSNSGTYSNIEHLEMDSNSDTYVYIKLSELDSDLDIEFDLEADPDLFFRYFKRVSLDSYLISLVGETLSLEPQPELISLIYQIFSLVVSMYSEWKRLIFLYPQVQVKLKKGKFQVIDEEVSWSSNGKWKCLPFNWKKIWISEEGVSHIRCQTCNGENHGEYEKAPVVIKHTLHPKHSLQLVLLNGDTTRECYCCDKDLEEVFYYCSACDYAMNIACIKRPRVLSLDQPKWHEHTLAQFPRKTSLTCNVCALTHSSCPFYMCPPCDFVVHQKCISLPRVIRISRHFHRIHFTPSFDQEVRCCGVCRRKIDNDYGGYSCNKDGCSYAAHSKCATQSNVWDGKELEGEPEEDIKKIEPFVTVRDGIIRHFSHDHHHLKLDENIDRDYNENKLCQACITPIYFGNFYSCMQCDFILHEECAKLSRKIHHPVHPHLLTLVGRSDLVMDATKSCSICSWRCTTGFFYECSERECRFKVHVQCATISEPLVHASHMDPLFLTSKPGEERRCCVCKELGHCSTNETFNCIECDFALCFKCATLPQKVRYKHDKHMLTLSYGEETSTMTYWCEVCEKKINPKERFYMCDEYCCVTLHIECMLGVDLYMKSGSFWLYCSSKVSVLPNNHHMSRPICSFCKKRCPHNIVFQCLGLISCSTSCIRVKDSKKMTM
ncbi:DC1 [Arabidopsis suecica]|nr:DC1 [Arabidopsis suecica]